MTALKLSNELTLALGNSEGPLAVEDADSNQLYYVVDNELFDRAMDALRAQDEVSAIQAGIDDMEAGRVVAFEDVDAQIRARLGMDSRT